MSKLAIAVAILTTSVAVIAAAPAPSDSQIAHIAYTAGAIDITAAKQALKKSHNPKVRAFAQTMVRDHDAVNVQALALVKKLGVTPEPNPTSSALSDAAARELKAESHLSGRAFDRAYVKNEVAYHRTVNGALHDLLIPSAHNAELKSLLQTGLTLFSEHQQHAEMLAKALG